MALRISEYVGPGDPTPPPGWVEPDLDDVVRETDRVRWGYVGFGGEPTAPVCAGYVGLTFREAYQQHAGCGGDWMQILRKEGE